MPKRRGGCWTLPVCLPRRISTKRRNKKGGRTFAPAVFLLLVVSAFGVVVLGRWGQCGACRLGGEWAWTEHGGGERRVTCDHDSLINNNNNNNNNNKNDNNNSNNSNPHGLLGCGWKNSVNSM